MAKLITGSELNSEIEKLFQTAEDFIIIISPYIKLHSRIKDILNLRKEDDLEIVVIFGKNEDDKKKSFSVDDIDFFKDFRDVTIRYAKNLHAKVYANEEVNILTSMNLYSSSMNHNIEFGVVTYKKSKLERLANSLLANLTFDDQTLIFMFDIMENSEIIFEKEAKFKSGILKSKYLESEIKIDKTKELIPPNKSKKTDIESASGYCIRTGKLIPFNPKKPFTKEAYVSWAKYKNPDYKEKFCHKTGNESKGKTSFNNPILNE